MSKGVFPQGDIHFGVPRYQACACSSQTRVCTRVPLEYILWGYPGTMSACSSQTWVCTRVLPEYIRTCTRVRSLLVPVKLGYVPGHPQSIYGYAPGCQASLLQSDPGISADVCAIPVYQYTVVGVGYMGHLYGSVAASIIFIG